MNLYFKIGTGPGEFCHVVRKRKLPVVGEVFKIIWHKHKTQVRCCEIRNVDYELLFVVELW